jgi:hypothetical protein
MWGCRQTWSTLQTFENNNNLQRQECQLKGFRRSIPTLWPRGLLGTHLGYGPWLSPSLIFMRTWRNMTYLVSNSLLFLCVFWGISPSRRTLGRYARGASQIVHVLTFPWRGYIMCSVMRKSTCITGIRTLARWRPIPIMPMAEGVMQHKNWRVDFIC